MSGPAPGEHVDRNVFSAEQETWLIDRLLRTQTSWEAEVPVPTASADRAVSGTWVPTPVALTDAHAILPRGDYDRLTAELDEAREGASEIEGELAEARAQVERVRAWANGLSDVGNDPDVRLAVRAALDGTTP